MSSHPALIPSARLSQLRAMGASLAALDRMPAERRHALQHLLSATAVALVCVALIAAWTGNAISAQVEDRGELLGTLAPSALDLDVPTAPLERPYDPHAPAVPAP